MYLLLLDKLYSLRLWSEQARQMNLPRLQKLCKPMSCCPGYQGFFFLACDGELRFVGLRPTRVARVTWPKSETAHEKPLPPRVMFCLKCYYDQIWEFVFDYIFRVRVWHWEFVVHNNISAVCHPRCLRSKYVLHSPLEISCFSEIYTITLNFSKARFRRRTFQEPYLIGIKADRKYLDRLNWFRRRS